MSVAILLGVVLSPPSPARADPGCNQGGVYLLWARGSGQSFSDVEALDFKDHVRYAVNVLGVSVPDWAWAELGNLDGDFDPQGQLDPGEYPAVGAPWNAVPSYYGPSVEIGTNELVAHLNDRYAGNGPSNNGACHDEVAVIGGYSQGADVVGWALERTGYGAVSAEARRHIGFVALYGDPRFRVNCNAERWWVRANARCDSYPRLLPPRDPYARPEFNGRFGSWCDDGDAVCAVNPSTLGIGNHTTVYRDWWIWQSAAEIAAGAKRRLHANNGPDFNLDGRSDLAWHQGSRLHLLTGQGGHFAYGGANPPGAPISTPQWAASGDVDGNGQTEVLWYQNSSFITLRWASGTWQMMNTTPNVGPADSAAAGDFTGDGRADITWHQGTSLRLFEGLGEGTFSYAGSNPGNAPIGSAGWSGAGDVDGDGQDEALWYEAGTLSIFRWGFGTWGLVGQTSGLGAPSAVAVGDFNGDHRVDLAWHQGTQLHFLTGQFNHFAYGGVNTSGPIGGAQWAGAGDIDNNGVDEVVWYQNPNINVFRWNGTWELAGTTGGIGAPDAAVSSS